jgi:hypothetical protein
MEKKIKYKNFSEKIFKKITKSDSCFYDKIIFFCEISVLPLFVFTQHRFSGAKSLLFLFFIFEKKRIKIINFQHFSILEELPRRNRKGHHRLDCQ